MKEKTALILAALACLFLASGCLRLGPDYVRPPQPVPDGFQHADQGPGAVRGQGQWWRAYGDEELNRLAARALARNLDLKKAAARVLELKARFVEAGSLLYPSLGVEAQAKRQQSVGAGEGLPPFLSFDRRTESYNLALAASYEVDFWGKLSRGREAALADLLAAEENRRTAAQTVVAAVVSSYLTLQATERRLQVADRRIRAQRNSLFLVEGRYRRGLTSVLDLSQARRSLARAKAVRPQLVLDLGREQQKLAVLTGEYPRTSPAHGQPRDYFPNLKPVPAGLPSELLLRRPDLRAAEAQLMALNARVGQAEAARFPSLKLTGAYGYASDALGALISPVSELWNLAAGLTQPIFDAGRLKSRQRAAEARYRQGEAAYAKAVLEAFREVEGALLARRQLLQRRALLREALREAVATQEIAGRRYRHGLTDYLRVLEATITRYELEDIVVLVELALLTNRVTLHRALGGGWVMNQSPTKR